MYTIQIDIPEQDLTDIVDVINKNYIDLSVGDTYLSVEEVKNKPDLLSYLLESYLEEGRDVEQAYSKDGFCDFEDVR